MKIFSMRNTNDLNLRPNYILKPCFRNDENGINEYDYKINISSSIYDYYSGIDEIFKKEMYGNDSFIKSKNFVKKSELNEYIKEIEIKHKNINKYNNNKKMKNKFDIQFNTNNNNIIFPYYNYVY